MKRKKQLKELTLKDNFMFGAVMMEEENCKRFLELALGFPIERVEVSKEKSIVYHPEYKGVRLDVYGKNEHNTRYNVEMQVAKKAELGKRVRYYHGQIDMELLLSGSDYTELPEVYVILSVTSIRLERKSTGIHLQNNVRKNREHSCRKGVKVSS